MTEEDMVIALESKGWLLNPPSVTISITREELLNNNDQQLGNLVRARSPGTLNHHYRGNQ